MGGIIVYGVIGIWMFIAFWIAMAITRLFIKIPWKAVLVFFCLFFPLLVLPIIDDVLIGKEFKKLCKEYTATQVDRASVKGKSVYTGEVTRTDIKRGLMEASVEEWIYLDAETDELVISHRTIRAGGGFLINLYPGSDGAFTFIGRCYPDGEFFNKVVFNELGMTKVSREDLNLWRKENANN